MTIVSILVHSAAAIMMYCVASVSAVTEEAPDPLRLTLSGIAKDVHSFMESNGKQLLEVEVKGPRRTSAAREVESILVEELTRLGVQVGPGRITLRVDFLGESAEKKPNREDTFLVPVLTFLFQIEDTTGDVLTSFVRHFQGRETVDERNGKRRFLVERIENVSTIAHVLGVPAEFSPTEPEFDQRAHLLDRQLRGVQSGDLDEAKIRAEKGSPFAIEVLVGRQVRRPSVVGMHAYVGLAKDDVYQVNLINDAEFEVAVDLRIDGLSMFRFSEAKGLRYMIVPPKSSVLIKGWHSSFSRAREFKITEYPDSAAAGVGQPVGDTGVITATFHAAWTGTPPKGEPGRPKNGSPLATGFGNPVDSDTKPVKRNIGVVRASVVVRYDRPRS